MNACCARSPAHRPTPRLSIRIPHRLSRRFWKIQTPILRPAFVRLCSRANGFRGKNRAGTLVEEITSDTMAGRIARVDAARQQAYVEACAGVCGRSSFQLLRRAPSAGRTFAARRDTKGVLDFPALVHAPIEKWLVSHLCRTTITPNQITLGTAVLGLGVTLLYACGYLWVGVLLALVIGVLDGVDGKLARLKAQTTKLGKKEHDLDYFIETSWWAALAYHFHATGQIRYAYVIFFIFFAFHRLERMAIQAVQRRIGRNLDDFAPFDRLVRSSLAVATFTPGCSPFSLSLGLRRLASFGSVCGA
jgi:phosphatidylglycerophosphate synthase